MTDKMHVNDIGTAIVFTILEDGVALSTLGSATTRQVKIRKPSGVEITKTASLVTDGSDGKMLITTVDGDLSEEGVFTFQPYIVIGSWQGHGNAVTQRIYEALTGS